MADLVSTMVQVHVARLRTAPDREPPSHSQGEDEALNITASSLETSLVRPLVEHLILRRSPAELLFPALWQCITGRRNPDETAVHTALRELHEECGLSPLRMWVLPFVAHWYDMSTDTIVSVPCFGITVHEHAAVRLSHEHDRYEWTSCKAAQERIAVPAQRQGVQVFHRLLTEDDTSLGSATSMLYEVPLV